MMTPMSDTARRSRITLIVLRGGVILVVIVALIAVFARGGAPRWTPDTPEGVVQRYSQAVVDGDAQTALTYLVPEIADVVRQQYLSDGDDMRITARGDHGAREQRTRARCSW